MVIQQNQSEIMTVEISVIWWCLRQFILAVVKTPRAPNNLKDSSKIDSKGMSVPRKHQTPRAGLPDLSWYNIPKREKCTKLPQNIPNDHKINKMVIKYSKWP
jgi:hypothetical protein